MSVFRKRVTSSLYIVITTEPVVSDVLRRQTGSRLGVHGHRVPDRREGALQNDRADRLGKSGRLPGVGGARQPDAFDSRVVDGRGEIGRTGDHDQGYARVAGRAVRAHRAPGLGVGRRSGRGGEPNGRRTVRRHRQAANHRQSGERHKGDARTSSRNRRFSFSKPLKAWHRGSKI